MHLISLSTWDLLIAAGLVVANALLSAVVRLRFGGQLLWAAARSVGQLLLVGVALRFVFANASAPLTVAVAGGMALLAAREVAVRPRERLSGSGNYWIGALAVGGATGVTTMFLLSTAIRPQPWYDPKYLIALVGIVLGSSMNAASLALDSVLTSVRRDKAAIEARIGLVQRGAGACAP